MLIATLFLLQKLDTGEIEIIVIEIIDVLPNRKRKRNAIDATVSY